MTSPLVFNNAFEKLDPCFFRRQSAKPMGKSQWVIQNTALGAQLGIDFSCAQSNEPYLKAFSGQTALPGSAPLAMIYAGHQFGHFVNQLGDGRGLLLGEIDAEEGTVDLHLKGAGPTPFSRMGDGRAVLRSCIREYLGSEALYALAIPSTRALCITQGAERVWRETEESAAMMVRVAQTHVRFGSFEYFHYSGQPQRVKDLADFCLDRYKLSLDDSPSAGFEDAGHDSEKHKHRYYHFFQQTVVRTARLIAQWQAVGFAHGVMNTDNMSILGETFDFGPYGFIDHYDERFICNHSDHSGRYAFNAQPSIGLWNLNALGHALSSLIEAEAIEQALALYQPTLVDHYAMLMRSKLGFTEQHQDDQTLLAELLSMMQASASDYTRTFRSLATISTLPGAENYDQPLRDTFIDRDRFDVWCRNYIERLRRENSDDATRRQQMNRSNPKFILRNYLAQQAIEKAEQGDFREVAKLADILAKPFEEQSEHDAYAQSPPDWAKQLTVSCSS